MSHAPGTYLGAVRCLETLRERCELDDATGCWHLRTARGRPQRQDGSRHTVYLHGYGSTSAPRATWWLATGTWPDHRQVVYRHCDAYDCVNPGHLRCGTRAAAGAAVARTNRLKGDPARSARCTQQGRRHSKLTPELARWIRTCGLSCSEAARQLGVAKSTVIAVRAGQRWRPTVAAASVFTYQPGAR